MNKEEIEFGVCCTTEYEKILLVSINKLQKKISKAIEILNKLKYKIEDEGNYYNELYELESVLKENNYEKSND